MFWGWPRRNESPRCARSLLSSEPVSSFPKHKRFAGLCFGGSLDGTSPRAAREASYPLSPFPPIPNANASLVCILGPGLDGTSPRAAKAACGNSMRPDKNPLPEQMLRQGILCVCYSISSRLDEAGTSFCFGSVTRRTPSAYAALMPAASMPEISKLLA